jgi:PAS domain S-box-containing protein
MRLATKGTETENLFEILANKSPVGLCIVQDGRFCYINSYFSATTGFTLDELVGNDSFVIVFPEDREAVRGNTANPIRDAEGRVV